MKPVIRLFGLLVLTLSGLPLGAQDAERPEVRAFQEAAGGRSVLYRGQQADRYSIPANGNPYWISARFAPGDIVFNGNHYSGVSLNIDAYAQHALVRLSGSSFALALTPDRVSSLSIEGHRFIGVGPGQDPVLPTGFYEVLGEGPVLIYKRVDKFLNSAINNVNGKLIGYYDENYNTAYTRYFSIAVSYYLRDREGRVSRFRGKNALLRAFPEQRKAIRKHLRDADLTGPGTDFDDICLEILQAAGQ